ncbi:MAG TPA: hypothetical protein VJB57_10045 [Dehalococcoidia bacterium]|nr:hypothetical protein [Dehalococcoidia bacterium]
MPGSVLTGTEEHLATFSDLRAIVEKLEGKVTEAEAAWQNLLAGPALSISERSALPETLNGDRFVEIATILRQCEERLDILAGAIRNRT